MYRHVVGYAELMMKSSINEVASYIAFHYGLPVKDVLYMLERLERQV